MTPLQLVSAFLRYVGAPATLLWELFQQYRGARDRRTNAPSRGTPPSTLVPFIGYSLVTIVYLIALGVYVMHSLGGDGAQRALVISGVGSLTLNDILAAVGVIGTVGSTVSVGLTYYISFSQDKQLSEIESLVAEVGKDDIVRKNAHRLFTLGGRVSGAYTCYRETDRGALKDHVPSTPVSEDFVLQHLQEYFHTLGATLTQMPRRDFTSTTQLVGENTAKKAEHLILFNSKKVGLLRRGASGSEAPNSPEPRSRGAGFPCWFASQPKEPDLWDVCYETDGTVITPNVTRPDLYEESATGIQTDLAIVARFVVDREGRAPVAWSHAEGPRGGPHVFVIAEGRTQVGTWIAGAFLDALVRRNWSAEAPSGHLAQHVQNCRLPCHFAQRMLDADNFIAIVRGRVNIGQNEVVEANLFDDHCWIWDEVDQEWRRPT